MPGARMRTARHFVMTTLPALGGLGTVPPVGLADLLEHLDEDSPWREAVEAVILSDDLLLRESFLAGEMEEVEPVVLSLLQARGDAPLPERLFHDGEAELAPLAEETDRLWAHYFHYVASLARSQRCDFLEQWVTFEVTLRNALARTRARRLGLDESRHEVLPELAHPEESLALALADWESAATPVAGWRAILRVRWDWVDRHEAWFSFSLPELLAYVLRVILLTQWVRSAGQDEID